MILSLCDNGGAEVLVRGWPREVKVATTLPTRLSLPPANSECHMTGNLVLAAFPDCETSLSTYRGALKSMCLSRSTSALACSCRYRGLSFLIAGGYILSAWNDVLSQQRCDQCSLTRRGSVFPNLASCPPSDKDGIWASWTAVSILANLAP